MKWALVEYNARIRAADPERACPSDDPEEILQHVKDICEAGKKTEGTDGSHVKEEPGEA